MVVFSARIVIITQRLLKVEAYMVAVDASAPTLTSSTQPLLAGEDISVSLPMDVGWIVVASSVERVLVCPQIYIWPDPSQVVQHHCYPFQVHVAFLFPWLCGSAVNASCSYRASKTITESHGRQVVLLV
jgi:hypothetical protein